MKMATNIKETRSAKRSASSTLAMSFDPLGLISTIGVHAKALFRIYVEKATIIAKSSWNAAENGCGCTLSSLQRAS